MLVKTGIGSRLIMWNWGFIFTLIFHNWLTETCSCHISCHWSKVEIILFLVHLFIYCFCILWIVKPFLNYYLPWQSFWVIYIDCLVHLSWWKDSSCWSVYNSAVWFAGLNSMVVNSDWARWLIFSGKNWRYFRTFLFHILAWGKCLSKGTHCRFNVLSQTIVILTKS